VFEVRDLWPEGAIQLGLVKNRFVIWVAQTFERMCYRAATRVVACSEGQAEWIRKHHGVSHVDVVPHGSDNDLVASLDESLELPAWAEGKHLVLYTGALGLIDDCSQMLDVAEVFQKRGVTDVEFVLIGDGKERAELEEEMRRRRLHHVRFLGFMSKFDVMRWLLRARCSLFLVKDVPFLATASPNKLYDSFAAGVPVVQATDGWIKDLLDRQQCGITVPAGDRAAMADAVERLIRDDKSPQLQAASAHRVGRSLFDRTMLARRMRRVLRGAIDPHRSEATELDVHPYEVDSPSTVNVHVSERSSVRH
jgi:glycosyltransferase involved in cell wall biosynthesis